LVARMAQLSDGEVIFFGLSASLPAIDGHRGRGGRSVHLREGLIVLATGGTETVLTDLASIPMLTGSNDPFAVESVLAAAASAWALGLPIELIRTGLETTETGPVDVRAIEAALA